MSLDTCRLNGLAPDGLPTDTRGGGTARNGAEYVPVLSIWIPVLSMIWSRISEALFFYRQHLLALFGLLLPVLVPVSLFLNHRFYVVQGGDPEKAMSDGLAMGLQMVAGLYANALVIRYTLAHLGDQPVPGYGKLWQEAMSRVPALFVVQILVGLLVFAGLLLFILPGVWLLGVFMPAYVVAIAETKSGVESVRAAWGRYRPGAWQIAASLGGVLLGLFVVMTGFATIEQLIQSQATTLRWMAGSVLDVAGLMFAQTVVILMVRFYDLERSSRST